MNEVVNQKIEAYFGRYPLRTYDKGQILIHGSENPEHIYYLVSGNVRQYDISYRGDEVVVNVYRAGAFFPMLWAITKLPNRYFFAADTRVQVRVAPNADVLAFLDENPDVVYDLLARLYRGVDGLLGRMSHLMAGSARSRLLYELIVECRRSDTPPEGDRYQVELTEAQLASHAGLSRETVSRELQKLSRDGLVELGQPSAVGITSLHLLEEKLGTDL